MRRTLLFVISLFAVFALVACGSKKQVDLGQVIKNSAETLKTTTFESNELKTPKAPQDMKFAGWYRTSIGQSVFEPKPLQDGDFVQGQKVYPYFIPQNDKTYNWGKGATFYSSGVQAYYQNPLNPFTSNDTGYNNMISSTQIQLVRTVPNWRQAVKDGLAKYPFDFSKLNSGQASFNNVQELYVKDALAKFPMDSKGNEHLNQYGEFDNIKSADYVDTVWSFELKHGLKFAVTNTPIDAYTYEFGIKTALDPVQNNIKGKTFYKDAKNTNGAPILNAKAYYNGTDKDWSKVGFKVDPNDNYKFIMTFSQPVSQSTALGFASEIPVVEPAVYNKTLNSDKSKSSYGTDANSYSNSGAYILKEFNNKSKVVFNKNFDYPLAYLFPNKSTQTTLVQDQQAKLTDFVEGNSIAISLTGENKDKLSKWQSTTKDVLGDSARLMIFNLTKSSAKTDKVVSDPIIGDPDFRRALLFAINRNDLAANAGFPGQPVAIPVSNDGVQYITSKTSYAKSDFHKQVLQQYGLKPTDGGFSLSQAQDLLKKAYKDNGYQDDHIVKLVVVRPDDDLWKATFNEIAQNFKDAFGGKVVLVDKPLSGQASDEATKTYNWDLLLTGLSAGTYYDILWQFCAINFAGSFVGAKSLGINGPVDNYVTDKSLIHQVDNGDGTKTQVHYGEYYNQSFEVNLPATYAYLKSKFEDKHSEYYNVDGSVKDTYKQQEEVYNALKEQGGTGKGTLSYDIISNDLALDNNSVLQPVNNTARYPGAAEESYQLTQIFDKLFFEFVPSMGLYTNAGKVVYKPSYANMWQQLTLRWDRGPSAYKFLTTDPYYVEFADPTLTADQIAQKVLDANVPEKIQLTLPQGLNATLANQNSATLQGSTITTYVGNTVELTLNTGDASKSIYSLTVDGQTIPCVTDKPNSFIFVAQKGGQIQATPETTHYTIKNLPEGVTANVQSVEYNQPVTFTLTPPTASILYSLTVGGTDYTDQVKNNTLTIDHLQVNPTVQVSFITPITISSEWKPVIEGSLITVGGKTYVQAGVVTAFNRVIPGDQSAKEYSITLNGQEPTSSQFTTKYEYNVSDDQETESVKDLVLTLVLDGNFTQPITVTDLPAKDLAKVFTATKDDNFQVQFNTPTAFPGVDITKPTEDFASEAQGTVQFNVVGSQVSFSVSNDPGNYTLTSVTYNGQTLTQDPKTKLYTITVVEGQEVKVVVTETDAHKQLVALVASKFNDKTVIAAQLVDGKKSLQGIANGVYPLLGDGAQDKYDVSVSLVARGIVNVTITQKVDKDKDAASVVVPSVAYKFPEAQPAAQPAK